MAWGWELYSYKILEIAEICLQAPLRGHLDSASQWPFSDVALAAGLSGQEEIRVCPWWGGTLVVGQPKSHFIGVVTEGHSQPSVLHSRFPENFGLASTCPLGHTDFHQGPRWF